MSKSRCRPDTSDRLFRHTALPGSPIAAPLNADNIPAARWNSPACWLFARPNRRVHHRFSCAARLYFSSRARSRLSRLAQRFAGSRQVLWQYRDFNRMPGQAAKPPRHPTFAGKTSKKATWYGRQATRLRHQARISTKLPRGSFSPFEAPAVFADGCTVVGLAPFDS